MVDATAREMVKASIESSVSLTRGRGGGDNDRGSRGVAMIVDLEVVVMIVDPEVVAMVAEAMNVRLDVFKSKSKT